MTEGWGMLDEGVGHLPGKLELDGGSRFDHVAQNSGQFKTSELFVPGIFHFIFADCS